MALTTFYMKQQLPLLPLPPKETHRFFFQQNGFASLRGHLGQPKRHNTTTFEGSRNSCVNVVDWKFSYMHVCGLNTLVKMNECQYQCCVVT
jgi:hypothetical protein